LERVGKATRPIHVPLPVHILLAGRAKDGLRCTTASPKEGIRCTNASPTEGLRRKTEKDG